MDSAYLVDLARNEGSFLAEYRVDPRGFDTLLELLRPALERNEAKAAAAGNDHCGLQVEFCEINNYAASTSGSLQISAGSRLGAAWRRQICGGYADSRAFKSHGE